MRYSRWPLLVFGVGLVLGLVAVSIGLPVTGRIASTAMALGVVAFPVALIADWWRWRPWHDLSAKRRGKSRSPSSPRQRGPKGKRRSNGAVPPPSRGRRR